MKFKIPDQESFSGSVQRAIESGVIVSKARQEITRTLLTLMRQYTRYPTSEQYTGVCQKLISKYPKLRDPIGSNGFVSRSNVFYLSLDLCMHTYTHVHMYTQQDMYAYTHRGKCIYAHMCAYVLVPLCMSLFICVHACTCMCISLYVCVYHFLLCIMMCVTILRVPLVSHTLRICMFIDWEHPIRLQGQLREFMVGGGGGRAP